MTCDWCGKRLTTLPTSEVYCSALCNIEALEAQNVKLQGALKRILLELGVPGEEHPASVAHAVRVAQSALKEAQHGE